MHTVIFLVLLVKGMAGSDALREELGVSVTSRHRQSGERPAVQSCKQLGERGGRSEGRSEVVRWLPDSR